MKIVHICIACFFPDKYSYQENMLPKYHKILGYDVSVIAGLEVFDENGKSVYLPKASSYDNEYGIPVIRLALRKDNQINKKLKRYVGLYEALEKTKPDVMFIHGCQFLCINEVVRYLKKHSNVTVFVDNHADFSNSATNFISKNILHKIIWKSCAKKILPFTSKFYGVLPARVEFLKDIYGLPKEKVGLLVMGADDEFVGSASQPTVRKDFRKENGLCENDFVIAFGGKIDGFKKQVLLLMDAVNQIDNEKLKLIVFGSVTQELKQDIESRCSDKVKYIGWKNSEESYNIFASCDLACFPGRHSVFWEQVTGQGTPMLVKHWQGTTHIDLGGNVEFLYEDSVEEIKRKLIEIIEPQKYSQMKAVAVNKGMSVFSYRDIAKRSIEV